MLSTNVDGGLVTFNPIDMRWYLKKTSFSTIFLNSFHSPPKLYVCTYDCLFENQAAVLDTTTEKSPGTELPFTLSCP